MQDSLGDRMKSYEMQEAGRRFIPGLPVYARIDGRTFSKFTKGMNRPYDQCMARAMIETTKYLVEQTNACIGYTQSDEISLVWYSPDPKSEIFFGGRVQKMTSQLAALASVKFLQQAMQYWPEKVENKLPTFDARVFMLPNLSEATNCFVWREWDATKNSKTMAASHYYSHKELHEKSGEQKVDMLLKKGVLWNAYPAFFKRGTYVQRVTRKVPVPDYVPPQHRPESGTVTRSFIEELDMPPITKVVNREAVIFEKEKPQL
ncbi:MAG: tRNA(His) guanylyltransferase Thg1 family protein [Nitrosopumilaceae archaeon]|nr:tRNA(His) guanylyltransferase Thg1 family protein [Nitrosopumilaceae archaeon]